MYKHKCDIVLYKYRRDIYSNVCIGKTKRHLIFRQYEHLGKSIATDKPLRHSDKDVTDIRKHCHSLDHLPSIDNFSKLRMKNGNSRFIKDFAIQNIYTCFYMV